MADNLTVQQRSRVMARNKSKGTRPERYVHQLAEAAKLCFRKHDTTLPGKPDLVFTDARVVVFVDGDFWHGWRFPVWEHRLSPFWRDKIRRTRERDCRNFQRLRRAGWKVVRLWEHQIETDVVGCVMKLAGIVREPVDRTLIEARYSTMEPLKRRKRLPKP